MTIVAKGGIGGYCRRGKRKKRGTLKKPGAVVLPGPPRAPQGRWEMQDSLVSLRNVFVGVACRGFTLGGSYDSALACQARPEQVLLEAAGPTSRFLK